MHPSHVIRISWLRILQSCSQPEVRSLSLLFTLSVPSPRGNHRRSRLCGRFHDGFAAVRDGIAADGAVLGRSARFAAPAGRYAAPSGASAGFAARLRALRAARRLPHEVVAVLEAAARSDRVDRGGGCGGVLEVDGALRVVCERVLRCGGHSL